MFDSGPMKGPVVRKIIRGNWESWFAWKPVKIRGGKVWLRNIYRRTVHNYVDMENWQYYEYGTIFDVIKDEE